MSEVKKEEEKYPPIKCTTEWSVEDVHDSRKGLDLPKITDKQAYDLLLKNANHLHDWCVENGWVIIEELSNEKLNTS